MPPFRSDRKDKDPKNPAITVIEESAHPNMWSLETKIFDFKCIMRICRSAVNWTSPISRQTIGCYPPFYVTSGISNALTVIATVA